MGNPTGVHDRTATAADPDTVPTAHDLTGRRVHVLLVGTRSSERSVARRVGYDPEEAFGRAFERALGRSPAHWRATSADRAV